MGSRLRIVLVVAVAAVAAAGTVVGVTLATRQTPEQPRPLDGKPPIGTNLPTPAAADIRGAFDRWPDGSVETMQKLGREYPKDPVVQLYRGIALIWAGYANEATEPLQAAKRFGRDTIWEIQADDLLHPQYNTGYPIFQPTRANPLLERGSRLQRLGKQHSAERLYAKAARLAPDDDEAQVAAAVGRFDKANPSKAFSRLGPLAKRFPQSQVVRFYLGFMLAWIGERDQAIVEFRKAAELGPKTDLGKAARQFLDRVGQNEPGSETPNK